MEISVNRMLMAVWWCFAGYLQAEGGHWSRTAWEGAWLWQDLISFFLCSRYIVTWQRRVSIVSKLSSRVRRLSHIHRWA